MSNLAWTYMRYYIWSLIWWHKGGSLVKRNSWYISYFLHYFKNISIKSWSLVKQNWCYISYFWLYFHPFRHRLVLITFQLLTFFLWHSITSAHLNVPVRITLQLDPENKDRSGYCTTLLDLHASTHFGGFPVIDMNTFYTWTTYSLTRHKQIRHHSCEQNVDLF